MHEYGVAEYVSAMNVRHSQYICSRAAYIQQSEAFPLLMSHKP